MTDVLKTTAQVLSAYSGKKIAVGVSGGRDSMCLLHAVINCGAVEKSNVIAVHVNHMLRAEADSDERHVAEFCARNGVAFYAERVDVRKESQSKGLTIEQAARDLRYEVFAELVKSKRADVILTAHHALDNAETVLMHLFRGSGLDGLRGMAQTALGVCGDIVRPLLGVYPDELDEYAERNGIEYVVDNTNFTDDADRNFIRLNVLPLIEQRYRGAVRAVNELAAETRTAVEVLDSCIELPLITHDCGATVIADKALLGPLACRYVRRALEDFTLTDVTRNMIDRVVELCGKRSGASAELAHGVVAVRESSGVALYVPREITDTCKQVVLGENFIDGLAVDVACSDIPPEKAAGRAVDLDKIMGATLRFRRDGDMFTPFGGGRKKLKQYFIDNKIPARKRDRIPLICSGSEVLVVVGMQISDAVKQTENTRLRGTVTLRF